jgi:ribosomal protein L7/L12
MSLTWIIVVTAVGMLVLAAFAGLVVGVVRAVSRRPTDLFTPPETAGGVPVRAQIEALARDGKKIHAIKLLRQASGLGLAEAKEAVERM